MSMVYVNWYGKTLQGEVVENNRTDSLADMVAVRIPLMGCHPVALFTPQHVYTSPEQIAENFPKTSSNPPKVAEKPQKTFITERKVSPEWQRLQAFKASHWDEAHNHLRTDALDEFYRMWRDAIAEKRGYSYPKGFPVVGGVLHPDIGPSCVEFISKMMDEQSKINADVAPKPEPQPITYRKPRKPIVARQLSLFD